MMKRSHTSRIAPALFLFALTSACGVVEEGDEEQDLIIIVEEERGEGETTSPQMDTPEEEDTSKEPEATSPMTTTPSTPAPTMPEEPTPTPPAEQEPTEPQTSPAQLTRTGAIMTTSRFGAGMTGTGILHVFGVKSGLNEMYHRGYSPTSGWTNEKFLFDTGGRPLINNFTCGSSSFNRVLCTYRAGDIGGDRFVRYAFGYGQEYEFNEMLAYIDDSSNNSLRHFASNYDILEDSRGSAVSVGKDNRRGTFSYWHEDSGQKSEFEAPGDDLIISLDATMGKKDQVQLFYIDDEANGLVYQHVAAGGASTLAKDSWIIVDHDYEPSNVSTASDEYGNVVAYVTVGNSAKGNIIIGRESTQGPLGDWKYYEDSDGKYLAFDHSTHDIVYSPTLGFVICGRDGEGYLSCFQVSEGTREFGFMRVSEQPILLTKPFEDDNLTMVVGHSGEIHLLWREDQWVSHQAPLHHAVIR